MTLLVTVTNSFKGYSNKLLLPSMNNLNYLSVAAQQCKLHVIIEIYQQGYFQTNNQQGQI
jgi:hypothetical protein